MDRSARDNAPGPGDRDAPAACVVDGASGGSLSAADVVVTAEGDHVGDLTATATVDVSGRVAGIVRGALVRIHPGACVDGEIHAGVLRVSGEVNGLCHATTVVASGEATLRGVVVADAVTLSVGTVLDAGTHVAPGNYRDRDLVSRARAFLAAEGLAPDMLAARTPLAVDEPAAYHAGTGPAATAAEPVRAPDVHLPPAAIDPPPSPLPVEASVPEQAAPPPAGPATPPEWPGPATEPSEAGPGEAEPLPGFRRKRRPAAADGAALPPAAPDVRPGPPAIDPAPVATAAPAPSRALDPASAIDALEDFFAPKRGDTRVAALAEALKAPAADDVPVPVDGAAGGKASGRRDGMVAVRDLPPGRPGPVPPVGGRDGEPDAPGGADPSTTQAAGWVKPFLIAPRQR